MRFIFCKWFLFFTAFSSIAANADLISDSAKEVDVGKVVVVDILWTPNQAASDRANKIYRELPDLIETALIFNDTIRIRSSRRYWLLVSSEKSKADYEVSSKLLEVRNKLQLSGKITRTSTNESKNLAVVIIEEKQALSAIDAFAASILDAVVSMETQKSTVQVTTGCFIEVWAIGRNSRAGAQIELSIPGLLPIFLAGDATRAEIKWQGYSGGCRPPPSASDIAALNDADAVLGGEFNVKGNSVTFSTYLYIRQNQQRIALPVFTVPADDYLGAVRRLSRESVTVTQAVLRADGTWMQATEAVSADDLYATAENACGDDQFELCATAARRATELRPEFNDAIKLLGEAQFQLGDFDGALREFETAVVADPTDSETLIWIGATHMRLGQYEEAIDAYKKSIAATSDKSTPNAEVAATYRRIGDAYWLSEKWPDSVSYYEKGISFEPDNIDGYLQLGAALFSLGQYEESVSAYESAFGKDRKRAAARQELMQALYMRAVNATMYVEIPNISQPILDYRRVIALAVDLEVIPDDLTDILQSAEVNLVELLVLDNEYAEASELSSSLASENRITSNRRTMMYFFNIVSSVLQDKPVDEAVSDLTSAISRNGPVGPLQWDFTLFDFWLNTQQEIGPENKYAILLLTKAVKAGSVEDIERVHTQFLEYW